MLNNHLLSISGSNFPQERKQVFRINCLETKRQIQLSTIPYHSLLIHVVDPLLSGSFLVLVLCVLCFVLSLGGKVDPSHWQATHLWLINLIGRPLEQLTASDGFVFAIGICSICRQTISEDNSFAFFLTMSKSTISFTHQSPLHIRAAPAPLVILSFL